MQRVFHFHRTFQLKRIFFLLKHCLRVDDVNECIFVHIFLFSGACCVDKFSSDPPEKVMRLISQRADRQYTPGTAECVPQNPRINSLHDG